MYLGLILILFWHEIHVRQPRDLYLFLEFHHDSSMPLVVLKPYRGSLLVKNLQSIWLILRTFKLVFENIGAQY